MKNGHAKKYPKNNTVQHKNDGLNLKNSGSIREVRLISLDTSIKLSSINQAFS